MNKKISIVFLTLGLAAFLIPACQNKSNKPTSQPDSSDVESESEEEHKHKYSSDWTYDHKYHWHAAICGHDVVKDKAEHNFTEEEISDGGDTYSKFTCTVCGYSYNDNEMFRIRWMSDEDHLIYSENYPAGAMPSYDVDTYGIPTKESEDVAYRYEFSHWSPSIAVVTKAQTYTAQYDQVENKYHVTWKNYDNTTLYEQDIQAGQTPVYPYSDPVRPDDGYDAYYSFEGWNPEPGPISEDTVYTAQFSRHVIADAFIFVPIEGGNAYEITGYNETPSGSITIPGTYHGKPVKGIADEAFKNCTLITSVTTPDSLEYLGDYVFMGCTGLVTFDGEKLDNITSFGKGVFKNCSSFVYYDESRDISNKIRGLSVIPEEMFYGCTSLGDTITGELFIHGTTIGPRAFYGCTNTRIFDMITSDIQRIEEEAFYGCTSFENLGIPQLRCNYVGPGAFKNCTGLETIRFNSIGGVTICDRAFENCTNLTNLVDLSYDSILTIGNYAFKNTGLVTANLKPKYTNQKSKLVTVGQYAFENCTSLETLLIPAETTTIGKGIIRNTPKLATLEVPFLGNTGTSTSTHYIGYFYDVEQSQSPWNANSNQDAKLLADVRITGKAMTVIQSWAFQGGTSDCQLVLPTTITTIKEDAFGGWNGITLDLNLPNLTSIEECALCAVPEYVSVPFIGTRPNTNSDRDQTGILFETIFSSRVYLTLECATIYTKIYPSKSFENVKIKKLVLGEKEISYLSANAFYGIRQCTEIRYQGTVSEFSAISKNSNWSNGCPVSKIVCTDGNYTI